MGNNFNNRYSAKQLRLRAHRMWVMQAARQDVAVPTAGSLQKPVLLHRYAASSQSVGRTTFGQHFAVLLHILETFSTKVNDLALVDYLRLFNYLPLYILT